MSDTNFFNGVDQNAKVQNASSVDPAAAVNAVIEPALIGEGKKYKDVLIADKALADKEAFILKLQEENASLRTTTTKLTTMEEALRRLEAKNMQPANGEQPTSATVANPANIQNLDPNKIQEMVEAQVSRLEQEKRAEANRLQVANQLTKFYGDPQRANEIIERKALELGTTPDYIRQQAKIAPAAVLQLLIPSGSAPPTQGIPPGGPNISVQEPVDYNPLKDPALNQFGKKTLDGKGFILKDAKSWEQAIASKMNIKHNS